MHSFLDKSAEIPINPLIPAKRAIALDDFKNHSMTARGTRTTRKGNMT